MRILVVEDDAPLASYIRKGLEAEHYAVDVALDGEQGALMARDLDYDLLVLDLNLPKLDGISLLRNLRPSKPEVPVLVLTARPLVEDRVHALDSGADDCINKPFSYSELSARVRALMRRGRPSVESILQIADLQLNRIERKVRRNGRQIELTAKEFALLEYLMRNAGRRITRSMIIEHVWNISFDTSTNVVDVYIIYGVGFANLVALPIAGKLRHRVRFRQILRDLTLEGVVSILEGINPRMLEAKLNGFLQQATEKTGPEAQRRVEHHRGASASRGAS
jgi:DNA-binding response OmpR family regulator